MSAQSLDLNGMEARAARATEDLELHRENRGTIEFTEGYSLNEKRSMRGLFENKADAELAVSESEHPTKVFNYLTPHGKWHIHSTYGDNHRMSTLSRGVWNHSGLMIKMQKN